MKNYLLILLTQQFPTRLGGWLRSLKQGQDLKGEVIVEDPLENIDYFPTRKKKDKYAVLTLSPRAWRVAKDQYPNIELYNYVGLTHGLVRALNETGYLVDIIDHRGGEAPREQYDLVVGHGAKCRDLIDRQSEETPIYQYISGVYWKSFNKESEERYSRFYEKHGGSQPKVYLRSMSDLIEGEEYLTKKADKLFTINCPRMIETYGEYVPKFHFTGLGAYVDPLFSIEARDFTEGRKNFMYVGGTGGNIQKGLDVLIEAFEQTPNLHLYIYCKVEPDLLNRLGGANIHYIYHWKYKPFHGRLRELLTRTNYSVHAPINIGMGTAFMATLGVGMIPVGYVDMVDPGEAAVLTDSWVVDSLAECINRAGEKSPEWCAKASLLSTEYYAKHCDPEQVFENFKTMFAQA